MSLSSPRDLDPLGKGPPQSSSKSWLVYLLFASLLVLGKALLVFGDQAEGWNLESFASLGVELLPAGVLLLPSILLQASPLAPLRFLGGLGLSTLALFWLFAGLTLHRTGSPLDPGEVLFVLQSPKEVLPAVLAEIHWAQGAAALVFLLLFLFLGSRRLPKKKAALVLALLMVLLGGASRTLLPQRPRHPEFATSLIHRFLPGNGVSPLPSPRPGGERLLPSPRGYWRPFREAKARGPRPNFLLFFLESVRANATTVYNPKLPTTPFLASLAKRSLVAERAYAFTNGTAKEMFTAFSGHPPQLTREHVEAGRFPTGSGLPRELVRLGYRTAFFYAALEFHEKQLLVMQDLGFQEHFTGPRLAKAFPSILRYRKRKGDSLDRKRGRRELSILRNYYGYEDRSLVDPILSWVRAHRERPWFLATLNLTTHHPYHAPSSWKRRTFPLPEGHPLPQEFQEYLNAVAYLDSVLGELLGRMEREGLLRNTIVVLIGDHGESFKENGFFGHGNALDENGVHVPLLLFGPEKWLGPPRRIHGLRSILDLVPTFASLVGVDWPSRPDSPLGGCDLLKPVPEDRELFLSAWLEPRKTALFQGSLRFLFDASFSRVEVYDLATDPGERRDLFSKWKPARLRERWARMMACRREIDRFFSEGDAMEIQRIRRKSLPPLAREKRVRLGDYLVLVGEEHPAEVPFFGYGTLWMGFRVLAAPPPASSLELRLVQDGEARAPFCVQDPNRLPLPSWRKGDRILLPVRMFFPNFIVHRGALQLQVRVVDRRTGKALSAAPGGLEGGWVPLGGIRVRESSWVPPPRSREEVLGTRFEKGVIPPREVSFEGKPLPSLLRRWRRDPGSRLLAALIPRLRKDPSFLERAFLEESPKGRWTLVPLFQGLGADAVPSLARLLDSRREDQALPAAEALRRIGFASVGPLCTALLPLSARRRARILSWIHGIELEFGPGIQQLFLDFLGEDRKKRVRAEILLTLSPKETIQVLALGLPGLREGSALERALRLLRILGARAGSLRPLLLDKAGEVSPPWRRKIEEALRGLLPRHAQEPGEGKGEGGREGKK